MFLCFALVFDDVLKTSTKKHADLVENIWPNFFKDTSKNKVWRMWGRAGPSG